MAMNEKKVGIKKNNKLMIIALLILLLAVSGATYAYFIAQKGTGGSSQIEVGAGTTDLLSFTNGNKINIVANQDNFKKGDNSITEKSSVTATLTPNNTTNIAHDTYNVYLIIENNDLEYTTSDLKPELVLKVINPLGEEVIDMKGFNYIENQGFDITNKKRAAYPLIKGYEIDADGKAQVDEWQIEVTLVNLESDQFVNTGKTFTGSILITSKDVDTYDLTEIKSMVSTTTYNSVNASLELDEGTNTIDKYYYAITETDEEPIALALTSVADALSYSYHESDEATYEFTTTDDGEKLKPNQNYKIFSYAKDIEGYQSNIYETIVTTDNYEIPVINEVTYSVTPNSITLNVRATPKSASIIKYQFSQNNGEDWQDFNGTTYTFNDLDEATVYEIAVRAIDEEENPSNQWHESITTGKFGSIDFPYEVSKIEDLVELSKNVSAGKTYAGEYFKLQNNLDFQNASDYNDSTTTLYGDINNNSQDEPLIKELTTGSGFKPIGRRLGTIFQGNFDGNNFAIKNLYINNSTLNNDDFGLFGTVKGSIISNLTVTGNIHTTKNGNIGGIAGSCYASTFTNVQFGLKEESSSNKSKVTSDTNGYSVGGIIGTFGEDTNGLNTSTLTNVKNYGNISNGANVGGIAGYVSANTTVNMDNCHNYELVSSVRGYRIGGIVGINYGNLNISNSSNETNITANIPNTTLRMGGLIGQNNGIFTIKNSHNTGDIVNENQTYELTDTVTAFDLNLGGIIGVNYAADAEKIINTYNTGDIIRCTRGGGMIGYNGNGTNITIDKAYNTGNITNIERTWGNAFNLGGIIGYVQTDSKAYVLNSYNTGNISGNKSYAGGLVGFANVFAVLLNSYNTGNVTKTSGVSGGVISFSGTGYVNNVYNLGTITGSSGSYAIGNYPNYDANNMLIKNAYYLNTAPVGSGVASNVTTSLSDNQMKGKELISNKKFVDILNSNITSATTEMKSKYPELSEYTLSKWTTGSDGYPILINK